jgi:hypothetical protein
VSPIAASLAAIGSFVAASSRNSFLKNASPFCFPLFHALVGIGGQKIAFTKRSYDGNPGFNAFVNPLLVKFQKRPNIVLPLPIPDWDSSDKLGK